MKKYEILLILPGTLDENEAETKIQETVSMIKGLAQDVSLNTLGKNRLAYPVKHIRYGYFYTATFSAEADKVEELKNKLNLSRDLLRALISVSGKDSDATKITYFGDGRLPRQEKSGEEFKAVVQEEIAPVEETPVKEVASEEVVEEKKEVKETAPVDLKEIDKKLDEILSEDNIIAGV